ncbi:hypothetical protein, partial [Streptomyces clavuligerus]
AGPSAVGTGPGRPEVTSSGLSIMRDDIMGKTLPTQPSGLFATQPISPFGRRSQAIDAGALTSYSVTENSA